MKAFKALKCENKKLPEHSERSRSYKSKGKGNWPPMS